MIFRNYSRSCFPYIFFLFFLRLWLTCKLIKFQSLILLKNFIWFYLNCCWDSVALFIRLFFFFFFLNLKTIFFFLIFYLYTSFFLTILRSLIFSISIFTSTHKKRRWIFFILLKIRSKTSLNLWRDCMIWRAFYNRYIVNIAILNFKIMIIVWLNNFFLLFISKFYSLFLRFLRFFLIFNLILIFIYI